MSHKTHRAQFIEQMRQLGMHLFSAHGKTLSFASETRLISYGSDSMHLGIRNIVRTAPGYLLIIMGQRRETYEDVRSYRDILTLVERELARRDEDLRVR